MQSVQHLPSNHTQLQVIPEHAALLLLLTTDMLKPLVCRVLLAGLGLCVFGIQFYVQAVPSVSALSDVPAACGVPSASAPRAACADLLLVWLR